MIDEYLRVVSKLNQEERTRLANDFPHLNEENIEYLHKECEASHKRATRLATNPAPLTT